MHENTNFTHYNWVIAQSIVRIYMLSYCADLDTPTMTTRKGILYKEDSIPGVIANTLRTLGLYPGICQELKMSLKVSAVF